MWKSPVIQFRNCVLLQCSVLLKSFEYVPPHQKSNIKRHAHKAKRGHVLNMIVNTFPTKAFKASHLTLLALQIPLNAIISAVMLPVNRPLLHPAHPHWGICRGAARLSWSICTKLAGVRQPFHLRGKLSGAQRDRPGCFCWPGRGTTCPDYALVMNTTRLLSQTYREGHPLLYCVSGGDEDRVVNVNVNVSVCVCVYVCICVYVCVSMCARVWS